MSNDNKRSYCVNVSDLAKLNKLFQEYPDIGVTVTIEPTNRRGAEALLSELFGNGFECTLDSGDKPKSHCWRYGVRAD